MKLLSRFAVPNTAADFSLPWPVLGLYVAGVWPLFSSTRSRLYSALTLTILVFVIVGEAIETARWWGNIPMVCLAMSTLLTGVHAAFKCFYVFNKRKDFAHLIKKFASTIWISEKSNRAAHELTEQYIIPSIASSIVITVALIIFYLEAYFMTLHSEYSEKTFPFAVTYPFDVNQIYVYEVTFVLSMWSGLAAVGMVIGHDTLMNYLLIYTCRRFHLLRQSIVNLGKENYGERSVAMDVASVIDKHNDFLEFAEDMEDLLGANLFVQFITTALLICIIGVQLMFIDYNMIAIIKLILYLTNILVQFFINCVSGQRLIDTSSSIAIAASDCDWVALDPRFHKNIILIIQRAQTPCRLTALKFIDLSMETFAAIVRASGSYFTLLRNRILVKET